MNLEPGQIISWAFYGMASLIGGGLVASLKNLTNEVSALSIKIATLIEKASHHERLIDRHDVRIGNLEKGSKD